MKSFRGGKVESDDGTGLQIEVLGAKPARAEKEQNEKQIRLPHG
jgi:hypothetical protein